MILVVEYLLESNIKVSLLLIFIFSFFGFKAHAYKYKKDLIHVSVGYTMFNDVRLRSGNDVLLSESIDVEAGLRFRRLFRTFAYASVANDSSRKEYGLGVRVDLPGFFLIDAKIQDFIRKGMATPINTSFYLIASKATFVRSSGAVVLEGLGTKYGLSMSWFPIPKARGYIRIDFGSYTVGGNSHLSYGLALGYAY